MLASGFTGPVSRDERFVQQQWRALLPTAYLLTGSDGAAHELLSRGLVAARRSSDGDRDGDVNNDGDSDSDDRTRALSGLVRAHLSRWTVRGHGTISGTSSTAWWSPPAEAEAAHRLATELDRLTPAERAAVVLRWYEGLPADQVTTLIPGSDPDAAAGRLAGEVPDRAELPGRLDGLAAQCDTSTLTDETAVLGVQAVRARRWRRLALAVTAALALGAGAVLIPEAVGPGSADRPSTGPSAALTDMPIRGSLSGDGAFLTSVLAGARAAGSGPGSGPPGVIFAGDVAGARAVLLVQQGTAGAVTTWLTGPAGARASDLRALSVASDRLPAAAAAGLSADRAGQPSAVLVVTAPGDEVTVSPGIDVAADGSGRRTFRPADAPDGVALVPVRSDARAALVRITRDDQVVLTAPPFSRGGVRLVAGGTAVESTADDRPSSRSGTPTVSDTGVSLAVDTIAAATGWGPEDLDVSVLGGGSFPLAGGSAADGLSVAAVLPGGAVITTTAWMWSRPPISFGTCGSTGHPAGTDPATLTVVARCGSYAGDSSTFGATLLVSTPPGTVVTLNRAEGGDPVVPELANGWGYVITDAESLTEYRVGDTAGSASRAGADLFSD